jgi:hypothetical protein
MGAAEGLTYYRAHGIHDWIYGGAGYFLPITASY